jgi:hypothetical protein
MKNIITKYSVASATLMLAAQVTQAVPLTGNIDFTGVAALDPSNLNVATVVNGWFGTRVTGASGDFSTIANNTPATFSSPWSLNTSTPITSFWTVDGFTFELLSSWITGQGGGSLAVEGTGIITGNGYTATDYSWSFTTHDPSIAVLDGPEAWIFSASSEPVPDGVSTGLLLGSALSAIGLIKRKLSA